MKMLTAQEVAKILKVHRNTVYLWLRAGRLPSVRCGKRVRVPEDLLEKWLEGRIGGKDNPT